MNDGSPAEIAPTVAVDDEHEESREERILSILRDKGPMTLRDLADQMAGVSYNGVYNLVMTGPSSLRAKKAIIYNKGKPGTVAANPDYAPADDIDAFRFALANVGDDDVDFSRPVYERIAEALMIYTTKVIWPRNDGKRLKANHLLKAYRNHTVKGAIERIVTGPATQGYQGLSEIGRADLTFEHIVLEFPNEFSPEAASASRARLDRREAA